MNNSVHVNNLSLTYAAGLVIVALIISNRQKLKLESDMIVSVIRAIVQLTIVGYVLKIHLFDQQHSCNCRNDSGNHFQCRPQCGKSRQRHSKAFLAFVHFHFDEHFDYSFKSGPERRNQVYSIANHSDLRNDCQQFDGGNRSLLQTDENQIPR